MHNLLKVEFYKLKKFYLGCIAMIFILVLGLYYGGYFLGCQKADYVEGMDDLFSWLVSDTSFVFLIALIAALFIGKDFSNHTVCNEIKLGYSRFCTLLSRMIAVSVFAISFHVAYILSTVLGFSVAQGFDLHVFRLQNLLWLLVVLIQLTAVVSGVVLISFVAKKASEAVALSTLYAFLCCNILRNYIDSKTFQFFCFCFVQENDAEHLVIATISAVLTGGIFLVIAKRIFQKAEIR